jgi:hypothetical protein
MCPRQTDRLPSCSCGCTDAGGSSGGFIGGGGGGGSVDGKAVQFVGN